MTGQILRRYLPFSQGQGQYTKIIKEAEDGIQTVMKRVNELTGIKESDTGLAPPALWDLAADKQTLQNEQPLQVIFLLILVTLYLYTIVCPLTQ